MKILLDTNIVLDLLLERKPYFDGSKEIFILIETKKVKGYLLASSITTLHYLIAKALNKQEANNVIEKLLKIFLITPFDKAVFIDAIANNGVDFEDSVIFNSALHHQIDYIITREKKGFQKLKVKVLETSSFLALYKEINSRM